jgi:hypothetical protein
VVEPPRADAPRCYRSRERSLSRSNSPGCRRRHYDEDRYSSRSFCKRKFEGGTAAAGERKKLKFIPPLKKRTVESVLASAAVDNCEAATPRPCGFISRFNGHNEGDAPSSGGPLGNRFQPPSKLPTTPVDQVEARAGNFSVFSRWSAPKSKRAPSNTSTTRWAPPPSVVSTTSLATTEHLPLKKRVYVDTPNQGGWGETSHPIVTTTEEDHCATVCEETVASLTRERGDIENGIHFKERGVSYLSDKARVVSDEPRSSKGGDDAEKSAHFPSYPVQELRESAATEPNSGASKLLSKSSTESPSKKLLPSVTSPATSLELSNNSSNHETMKSQKASTSVFRKPPHIHIKLPKLNRSASTDKPLESPGRAHIHIKLPKIKPSPTYAVSSPGNNTKLKLSPPSNATKQQPSSPKEKLKVTEQKKEAIPAKLHVPSLSSQSDIESKAQQILANARMRLQTLAKETSDVAFVAKQETCRPAVLSESPVSVPSGELLHDAEAKVSSVMEPSVKKLMMKPEAVRILQSEVYVPQKSDASLPMDKLESHLSLEETCQLKPPSSKHNPEQFPTKKSKKSLKVNTGAKINSAELESELKQKKIKKKPSTKAKKIQLLSKSTPKKNRGAPMKKPSFDLSDLLEMDDSDSGSSTNSSSSSSSCSSSSSSSSSSCSSSSSSSSDSDSSSSSSSSSSDSDSDDTTVGKKPVAKKQGKKPKQKHARRRSSADVIMGPAPPKEQALTDSEIRRILQQDSSALGNANSTWVRRSSRQPSKNLMNSASVKDLLNRLQCNDSDMVVLKMKRYLNDPNVPPLVMNAALDALEENSNCQALYIQVCIFCP